MIKKRNKEVYEEAAELLWSCEKKDNITRYFYRDLYNYQKI